MESGPFMSQAKAAAVAFANWQAEAIIEALDRNASGRCEWKGCVSRCVHNGECVKSAGGMMSSITLEVLTLSLSLAATCSVRS